MKQTVTTKYTNNTYTAEVKKGESIKIINSVRYEGEATHNNEFKIGDEAEYDSWNLKYTGKIEKITDKSVFVKKMGDTCKRMTIAEFCDRNYDFDAQKVSDYNYNEMLYI